MGASQTRSEAALPSGRTPICRMTTPRARVPAASSGNIRADPPGGAWLAMARAHLRSLCHRPEGLIRGPGSRRVYDRPFTYPCFPTLPRDIWTLRTVGGELDRLNLL